MDIFIRTNMKQLILASESPRRKQILEQAHIPFSMVTSNFNELPATNMRPEDLVMKNAEGKATEVAQRIMNAIIIGADSIVYVNNTILEKPTNEEDAKRMLALISGTSHQVYTGYSIVDSGTNKTITH